MGSVFLCAVVSGSAVLFISGIHALFGVEVDLCKLSLLSAFGRQPLLQCVSVFQLEKFL